MTATLDEIHRYPAIIDRAIERQDPLEITHAGRVAATLTPRIEQAGKQRKKFDPVAHRAWLKQTWRDRQFTDDEVREMSEARDRIF